MRVLVLRAGALGDLLLLRGVLASLRAAGHEPVLMAPAGPGAALVGRGLANVADVMAWDGPRLLPLHVEKGHEDRALRASLGPLDAALAYTRTPVVVDNLGHLVPRVITRDPQPPPDGPHAATWLCQSLEDLDVPAVDPPVEVASPDETRAAAEASAVLPSRFLAIHAGSGSLSKNWSVQSYAALVDQVAPGERFLLVEGPAEAGSMGGLREHDGAVLASSLPLRVLGALLSRAGLYVGNDSGVSHLAAAWGAPSLVLFGRTDPALFAPVGPAVRVLRGASEDMDSLGIVTVVRAARETRT
jgi:heptosyltransferase III